MDSLLTSTDGIMPHAGGAFGRMSSVGPEAPVAEEAPPQRPSKVPRPAPIKPQGVGTVVPEETAEDVATSRVARLRKRWLGHAIWKIMETNLVQVILSVMLFISLFLPDIWILANPPNSADSVLNAILFLSFGCFVIEIMGLFIARKEYRTSFFFCMDVLGTLSILLDITMDAGLTASIGDATETDVSVLRAARLAKIGAKSGRLAKLVRLFRLLFNMKESKETTDLKGADQVSSKLSKLLAQRVAALVMVIIVCMPMLTFTATDVSPNSFVETFNHLAKDGSRNLTQWDDLITHFHRFYNGADKGYADMVYQVPISISIQWKYDETLGEFVEETWDWSKEFDVIRTFNRRSFSSKRSPSLVKAKFNAVAQNREDSLLSILLILMVILLLLAFSASFNASVEKLVVDPLKRIITSLRESGKAILESVNATAAFEDSKEDNSDDSYDLEEDEGHEEVMETDLLEIMVAKLARIVNHTVPGGNKKLIDNMHVDADTAEWLTKEYLTEESNTPRPGEAPRRMSRMTTLKMMRSTKMMTADQQRMDDWHLDPMALGNEEKFRMIAFMFQAFDIREEFQVPDEKLMGFLTLISSKYAEAPTYHNWIHAFDVTHTVYRFVTLTSCHRIFSNLEIFSLMVAVVGHDVGHPGVNNNFLVATKNELAIVHNDRSPLENMHCATLYAILRDELVNVFGALNDHQWRDARKYIISMILNTDMTNHFENVSHLQVFYELAGEEIRDYWATVHKREGGILIQPKPLEEKDKRLMLLEIVLHAADISNPIKPFDVYEQWADRVMEEFFTQGDKEREEGLDVAAMYDRNLADKPSAQVGFIEFIVVPLYLELLRFAPGLDGIIPHMLNNHETYCNQMIAAKESDPDADKEAIAKLKDKPSAFRKRFEGKLGEHRVQTAMDQNPIVKKPSMKVSPPH